MVKIRLIFLLFCMLFALIIGKLFFLQIVSPVSSSNYLKYRKITPARGRIFDRNGDPLALNQISYLLYAEPKKIKEKNDLIEKTDKIIQMGEATLEARLDDSKDWVRIKSGLLKEEKDALDALHLEGLGFEEGSKRYYPESSLAAHILGFVGKSRDGLDVGYFGIEGFYDKDLIGLPGVLKAERDIRGRPILLGVQEKIEPEDGRDLILTIDKSVQQIAKTKLKSGLERYQAKEGCVIIADPYTMELVASTCLPDFDPTTYFDSAQEYFRNPSIFSLYEPGSTFKPLVVAAALNSKKIKISDTYNEKGPIKLDTYEIRTWNNKYEGKISITRILEKSSNVGMVYIGQKLGEKKLHEYLSRYGFGAETGVDLQGEVGGYFKSAGELYPVDYAAMSFGQGIAVTPLQMLRSFAAVINGGELLRPHVVKKVVVGGEEVEVGRQVERRMIDEHTSALMRQMLVSTVEHGEYKWIKPEGYKIGGKTGTAQIPVQGRYDPSKTIASFIGFAPADHPKFIVLVILKEPKSSIYGSETAAPLFFELAKDLLVYYNIAPGQ